MALMGLLGAITHTTMSDAETESINSFASRLVSLLLRCHIPYSDRAPHRSQSPANLPSISPLLSRESPQAAVGLE